MRAVRDAGHETGIHCWDHVRWQDGVAVANAAWTHAEMQRALERVRDIAESWFSLTEEARSAHRAEFSR